ncbi:MarC family protein [Aliiruegeria lutimaris]|uniref:UPF0056 membrane protein n=1 Tax=Aliiruegeria lutimaris TaxID=571298 RepID=A0A1G8MVH1_9RHOB|nr:MarC family protein [Aliiruegeria lutimaris]SDI72029.1 MarC family integral membrane protein [Aliiruegeria lutimaris]
MHEAISIDLEFAIKFFGALFTIMNPITNLPVFLGVTEGASPQVQRAIAIDMIATGLKALLPGLA